MKLGDILNKLQEYIDANLLNNKQAFVDLFTEYQTKEVGSNIDDVKNVSLHVDKIDTIVNYITSVDKCSENIGNINTVASNIPNEKIGWGEAFITVPNQEVDANIEIKSGTTAIVFDSVTIADGYSLVIEENAKLKIM